MERRGRLLALLPALGAALAAVALGSHPLLADFRGAAWRYARPIAVPAGVPDGSLVAVAPDRELFAGAASGLADVRIVAEGSGQEAPYKLLIERGEVRRSLVSAVVRDLRHAPGEYTSFVADIGLAGALHSELEVLTPTRNFQHRVTVEASDDGLTWAMVQEKGQVFDFTLAERGLTQRHTRVTYPPSTARRLRVRIMDGAGPRVEVAGVSVYYTQELPAVEVVVPSTLTARQEEQAGRRSLLVLDLGSPGQPTSRLAIASPQANFYRQASVEGSDDGQTWRSLKGAVVVYAFDTPRFVGSSLSVSYPEVTHRYLRLAMLNEDDPPLPVGGVTVYGVARRLVFPVSEGASYRLYYGNAQAKAPSYDLEHLYPYLVTEDLPLARLGPEEANRLFAEPSSPLTERVPWLLPAAVAVAALSIGLFLSRLLGQVRRLLPPPGAAS